MKKGLVIGGGIVGAVVIVIVVVSVFVLSNLDGLVKEAVEKVGTEATQAKVTLDKVEIGLQSGSGALRGLTVGNPKGFKTPAAFKLGAVSLKIDTGTVTSDPVVIKEIVIDKPQMTYELGAGGSNVDAIQKNVDAYAKQFSSGEKKQSSGGGPKLVIENLYIRGGTVGVSADFLQGKSLETPLPAIHLKDIGKEKKGASPAEVAEKVIQSMTKGVGSAVGKLDLQGMMKGAGEAATKAMEGATKAMEGAASGASGAVEGAGKAMEDATGGIKKLFGK